MLLLILACWLQAAARGAPYEIWVAPDGDDAASGSREQPLASPALALRRVRELRRLGDPTVAEGVAITFRGGTYFLREPLRVRPEDSGTPASPTVLQAAPGETPVLSGGVVVDDWQRPGVDPPGLPAVAQGKVVTAPLPQNGECAVEFRQLWVAGRRASRARAPNAGAMHRTLDWDRDARVCVIAADDARAPADVSGLEMTVVQAWEIAQLRIRSGRRDGNNLQLAFHEPESRLQFEHPWPPPTMDPRGAPYFLTGAIEFLDEPGEFFVDRQAACVYYWPREGEPLPHGEAVVPRLETVLQIAGTVDRPVSYVEVRGLTFSHAAWNRPATHGHVPLQATMALTEAYKLRPPGTPEWRSLDNQAWIVRTPAAVTVAGAHHIQINRCRFEHAAAAGLDLIGGTHDDRIDGCVFRDLGGNGLQLGSFQTDPVETHLPWQPDDERLICTRTSVANNLVVDCANEDWGGVGICVGYAREVAIEHNDISDCSYSGISLGWGWTRDPSALRDNRVVANRIHHIATRMADTAGIYTLSSQPGTVIRDNVVSDIVMSDYVHDPSHWFYIYLDEGSSWITVHNNWCPAERFLANSNGPGNVWRNNGPMVDPAIKDAAGLQPEYRDLLDE